MKKKVEFKQMNITQLKEKLTELRKDLMKTNTQRATHTIPENPGNIKQIRRNIARMLTFMKQKSNQSNQSNQREVKSKEK